MKAKILFCHNYYQDPGGESLVFENQVKGLRNAGHPIVLYTRHNAEIDQLPASQKIRLSLSSFHSSKTQTELSSIIINEKPAVAIVQNFLPLLTPAVYTTLRSHNIPIIQAVYNYRFVCPDAHLFSKGEICERCVNGNFAHSVIRRCYRDSFTLSAWYASILWSHSKLGTFDAISQFMVPDDFLGRKLVEGGIPVAKIRRNVNAFFVNEYTATYDHDGYILYVGRLVKQKGILTLIKAVAAVKHASRLIIVGKGELKDVIEDLIQDLSLHEKVTLLEPCWGADMRRLMERAMAVVVPSEWYDNLPLIVCQSYATGKPVIASRINGIPEYVEDKVDGILFEPGNHIALANAIDHLATLTRDSYLMMAKASRLKAELQLDFSAHYKTLHGMISEVLLENVQCNRNV